ncbi:MAG TPA: hypothetical protein P5260_06685 [Candidatus Competibacter sp.]|nr:hypothetical protein [Candidatus Competibacter sp.]HRF61274.1 hypothetical protein [Candidatus Competibacter sp.]HRX60892.1 hypothetical protein [Candidatus Competibacter sp.]
MSIRRDYKPASAWQRRRQAVRRHGLLVVTLILIGLFGGLLAYIRKGDQQPSVPAATALTQPPSAPATVATPKPVPQTVAPLAPVKPKYDFYTELPKRQIDIRREEHKPQGIPPKPPARPQPAANLLRKPTAPKKNTAPPTVATDHRSKPAAPSKNASTVASDNSKLAKPAAPSKNTTATATVSNNSKPTAPIRHLTTPPAISGANSATPIRHATTPTAATASGVKPARSSKPVDPPHSTQPLATSRAW